MAHKGTEGQEFLPFICPSIAVDSFEGQKGKMAESALLFNFYKKKGEGREKRWGEKVSEKRGRISEFLPFCPSCPSTDSRRVKGKLKGKFDLFCPSNIYLVIYNYKY